MEKVTVNIVRFARIGQKNKAKSIWSYFYSLVLSVSLLTLSGCATSGNSVSLAPNPPEQEIILSENPVSNNYSNIEVAAGSAVVLQEGAVNYASQQLAISPERSDSGCSIKDRFDRKALIAYEWDRSRLSMDVDGLGFGGSKVDQVRLEYKIRLQPEKPKKLKCRYPSKWQGLVGTGYNELVERKHDTVYDEVKALRKKANPYLERFF